MSRRSKNWLEWPTKRVTLRLADDTWLWLSLGSSSLGGGTAGLIEQIIETARDAQLREEERILALATANIRDLEAAS